MARRAPAIERCVAVLNHLAAAPDQPRTLSELARDLDLSKATAHALLTTLTDAGYLTRDEQRKTYGLGPALIAVGTAAAGAYPAARLARPAMDELSDEFDLEVIASAGIGDEIVILARAGTPRPLGINIAPGQRLPLVPPLGTVFVAWAGDDAIEAWLGRLGPSVSERERKLYRRALAAVRERGYSVALAGEGQQRLVEALTEAGHVGDGPEGADEYALLELAGDAAYRINHIGAPVFGPGGEVALGLFLIGFRGQIPAEDVPGYATRLVEASEGVTAALAGHRPA